jgi:hypothetical protein
MTSTILLIGQCGLRLFVMADWLATNGQKLLSEQAFSDQFWKQKNFYFMAH